MMELPKPVCDIAGLAVGKTPQDLLEHMRTGNLDILDGILLSDESLLAVTKSLESLPKYRLRIEDQLGTYQQKFCRIQVQDCPDPVLIGLIAEDGNEALPTELENLIFWAIIAPDLTWHQGSRFNGELQVIDWRPLAKGKAIIAEPIGLDMGKDGKQLISALFGLSHSSVPLVAPAPPLVSAASRVEFNANLNIFKSIQARLLLEASSVQHPKWRFLSLYRILENAYLENIKTALLDAFDEDASKAVESAKAKLASEVNQLASLAESAGLVTEFEEFNVEVDAQILAGNKYITMLDRSAEKEVLYKAPEVYKKGVQRFYKMRCSIAHAGTSSVIYEQFSDANVGTLALLPSVEAIALKSLKITIQ